MCKGCGLGSGIKKAYHECRIITCGTTNMSVSMNHSPQSNSSSQLHPSPAPQTSEIWIYTDGACSGNPGPGGWGVLIRKEHASIELSGSLAHTTNNRMEMLAVIKALQWRLYHCPHAATTIVSDSQYVIRGITQWIHGWISNGWKTSGKKPVENQDLWQELWALVHSDSLLQWQWVRGHNHHPDNEHADRLARTAIHSVSFSESAEASGMT